MVAVVVVVDKPCKQITTSSDASSANCTVNKLHVWTRLPPDYKAELLEKHPWTCTTTMSFTPNSPYSPTSSLDDIAHPTSQAYMRTPSELPAMHQLPSLMRSDFHTDREDDYDTPAPTANRLTPNGQHTLPQGMSRVNEDSGHSTPILSRSEFRTSREDNFNSAAPMGNRLMSSSQHTVPKGMSRISENGGYNTPIPHAFPAGSCVSDGSGYSNSPTPVSLPTATQGETPMVIPPLIIDRMAIYGLGR